MKFNCRYLWVAFLALLSNNTQAQSICTLSSQSKLKIVEVTRPGVNDLVGNDFDPNSMTIVGYKKNTDGTRSAARFSSAITSIVNNAHKGELRAINVNSQMIGTSDTASGTVSYSYIPGQSFTYLSDALVNGVGSTGATAINQYGAIAGCARFQIPNPQYPYNIFDLNLATFWKSAAHAVQLIPTSLPMVPNQTISACITDLTDNYKAVGQVQQFGVVYHEGPAAVYWSKLPTNTYNFQVIPPLNADGDWNYATAVNESGMVVGTSEFRFYNFVGDSTGFVWTPGEYAQQIMLAKQSSYGLFFYPAYPTDINNRGVVVGNSYFGPFLSTVQDGWGAIYLDQLVTNRNLIAGNPTIVSATKVKGEKILVQGRLKNSTTERTYVLIPECKY